MASSKASNGFLYIVASHGFTVVNDSLCLTGIGCNGNAEPENMVNNGDPLSKHDWLKNWTVAVIGFNQEPTCLRGWWWLWIPSPTPTPCWDTFRRVPEKKQEIQHQPVSKLGSESPSIYGYLWPNWGLDSFFKVHLYNSRELCLEVICMSHNPSVDFQALLAITSA